MRHLSRVDWIHMERLKLLSSSLYADKYCPNTKVSLLLCFTSSRWVFIFSSSLPKSFFAGDKSSHHLLQDRKNDC